MADTLVVNDELRIPRSELQFSYSRSPGPGGQNVNKVNTKATLHWNCSASESVPTAIKQRFTSLYKRRINDQGELVLSSSTHRTQRRNVDECCEKLRQLLLVAAVEPKQRKRRKRSAAAVAKRLNDKRARSQKKERRKPPRLDD